MSPLVNDLLWLFCSSLDYAEQQVLSFPPVQQCPLHLGDCFPCTVHLPRWGAACFDQTEHEEEGRGRWRREEEGSDGGRWRWKEASEEVAAEKSRNSPGKGSSSRLYGGHGPTAFSPGPVGPGAC